MALILTPLLVNHNPPYRFKNQDSLAADDYFGYTVLPCKKPHICAHIDINGGHRGMQKGSLHRSNQRNIGGMGREVGAMCSEPRLKEALDMVDAMDQQGISLDADNYASLLDSCAKLKALHEGRRIHAHMLNSGIKPTVFLWSKLVNMYSQCGKLEDAREVFDKMPERNVFSWNAVIAGYARHGLCEDALRLYLQMQGSGAQPDKFTFPRVLKACAGLEALHQGKEIHGDIVRRGLESDVFIRNALIDMYAKCGSLETARALFDKMPQRDIVSWNSMIAGYGQSGYCDEALKLFREMFLAGMKPDAVSITCGLSACAYLGALQQVLRTHAKCLTESLKTIWLCGMQ